MPALLRPAFAILFVGGNFWLENLQNYRLPSDQSVLQNNWAYFYWMTLVTILAALHFLNRPPAPYKNFLRWLEIPIISFSACIYFSYPLFQFVNSVGLENPEMTEIQRAFVIEKTEINCPNQKSSYRSSRFNVRQIPTDRMCPAFIIGASKSGWPYGVTPELYADAEVGDLLTIYRAKGRLGALYERKKPEFYKLEKPESQENER